jgi:hypothetical protein
LKKRAAQSQASMRVPVIEDIVLYRLRIMKSRLWQRRKVVARLCIGDLEGRAT